MTTNPSNTPSLLAGRETVLALPLRAERVIEDVRAAEREAFDRTRGTAGSSIGYRVENGAALMPIMGSLVSQGIFPAGRYDATSYQTLRNDLRAAAADPAVSRIALMIDSPGGAVSGVDATAAAIRAARQAKPVVAYVQGYGVSAAYWLASQADEIVATPLAEVGSIGVVMAHVDVSRAIEKAGMKITMLFSGTRKVDGNPYQSLPHDVRDRMTKELDALRAIFAREVAQGRGIDVGAVLATEARTYIGGDALKKGLVDRIGYLDKDMQDKVPEKGRSNRMNLASIDQEREDDYKRGYAQGLREGAIGERARIKAIVCSDSAYGRKSLAWYYAFETSMAADAVLGILNHAPREAAAPQRRQLLGVWAAGSADTCSPWADIVDEENRRLAKSNPKARI